jgi:hypothetical protein
LHCRKANASSDQEGSSATGTTGGTQGEQALIQWTNKTLPVVQQHLERAQSILATLK